MRELLVLGLTTLLFAGCGEGQLVGPDEDEEGRYATALLAIGSTVEVCRTSALNHRAGPGTGHAVLRVLPAGTRGTVTAVSATWYQVRVSAGTGWSSGSYLCPVSGASTGPGPASGGDPRHNILYYISEAPLSAATARPLVTYLVNGAPVDWMFDGMIVFSIKLHNQGAGVKQAEVDNYVDQLFNQGQLTQLANVVAEARIALADPGYRLKVYLTAPYVSGSSASTNVQRLLDRWKAFNRPELELVGFYWGYEEDIWAGSAAIARMKATAAYIHARGYKMVWIPYLAGCGGIDKWRSYGFDQAALQVGYAFKDVDTSRFVTIAKNIRDWGMSGVELETVESRNPRATALSNGLTYLEQARRFNWAENRWNAYYHGSGIAAHASGSTRAIYDAYYRHIAAHPRKSALQHQRVLATGDSYVEAAAGYRDLNRGSATRLNLGTNNYPNASRTYLQFSLAAAPPATKILAAHISLTMTEFPYPPTISDGQLYQVNQPWLENTITWNNQPTSFTKIAPVHTYATSSSYPVVHWLDVTEQVKAALASRSISFMLRRGTEDGAMNLTSFASREKGPALAPALQIVARP